MEGDGDAIDEEEPWLALHAELCLVRFASPHVVRHVDSASRRWRAAWIRLGGKRCPSASEVRDLSKELCLGRRLLRIRAERYGFHTLAETLCQRRELALLDYASRAASWA